MDQKRTHRIRKHENGLGKKPYACACYRQGRKFEEEKPLKGAESRNGPCMWKQKTAVLVETLAAGGGRGGRLPAAIPSAPRTTWLLPSVPAKILVVCKIRSWKREYYEAIDQGSGSQAWISP